MKKTFYRVHVEVERNIGNYNYTLVFKTLDEAKAKAEEINAYKITRHAFAESSSMYYNRKLAEIEEQYFAQHGDFAYGE